MRTLTVYCPHGLSNRLRVLLSGMALAEATGREFKMLWPITPACAAPFDKLFANPWPVDTVDATDVADLPYIAGWFGRLPDLLVATEPDLVLGHPGWLLQPDQFPGHDDLEKRCQALFDAMQPARGIQQAIDAFQQTHFRPSMLGVHVRRGDLLRQRPDAAGSLRPILHAVDGSLEQFPDAGILLCTDDGAVDQETGQVHSEGVRGRFFRRYGPSVMWTTPRSLDRRTTEAVQDALVDLWLLRSTDCFVGTATSSFSELAVWGRDVPHCMVAAGTPTYRRMEWLARRTGIYAAITTLGRHQFGHDVPFPALVRYYRGSPLRVAKRVLQHATGALSRRPQGKT